MHGKRYFFLLPHIYFHCLIYEFRKWYVSRCFLSDQAGPFFFCLLSTLKIVPYRKKLKLKSFLILNYSTLYNNLEFIWAFQAWICSLIRKKFGIFSHKHWNRYLIVFPNKNFSTIKGYFYSAVNIRSNVYISFSPYYYLKIVTCW